jgi:hypothetical protein
MTEPSAPRLLQRTAAILVAALALAGLLGYAASVTPGGVAAIAHRDEVDAGCSAWTDGCRICKRSESGEVACSNVGIACQRGPARCAERAR